MGLKFFHYLRNLTIILFVIILLGNEYRERNELIRAIIKIFLKKWNEVILPPQSIQWLSNYDHHQNSIWEQLHINNNQFIERPNILLILADDLGINDLSGGAGIATPHIDSIARNGLNFTQAYSSHATCAPSRAALFTGRYATSIGFEFTPAPKVLAQFMGRSLLSTSPQPVYRGELYNQVPEMFDIEMPPEIPTTAELLKEVGYHNYLLGKWDGGFTHESSPTARGFDESLSFHVGGSLYADANDPNIISGGKNITFDNIVKRMVSYKISHNNGPFYKPDEYLTDYLGKQSSQLISDLGKKKQQIEQEEQNQKQDVAMKDQPWFMTVAFTAPHNPFQALKSDYESEAIQQIPSEMGKIYASMILALDRNVGRMIEALKESNQYDNTIIIFTSDNGGAPYVGLNHLNAPFRGWKATLFEGGIRVPFLLQWPKQITQVNQKINDMIIHIDLLPSLYAIASKGMELSSSLKASGFISRFQTDGMNILSSLLPSFTSHSNDNNINKKKGTTTSIVQTTKNNFHKPHPVLNFHSSSLLSVWKNGSFNTNNNDNNSVITPSTDNSPASAVGKRVFYWRSGNYKALRYGDYKIQVHNNPNKIWFYNLLIDPTERENLINFINAPSTFDASKISTAEELEGYLRQQNSTIRSELAFGSVITSSSSFMTTTISSSSSSSSLRMMSNKQHNQFSEIIDISHRDHYNRDILLSNLIHLYQLLKEIDSRQRVPIWPSLVEVPVCIDKPAMSSNECLLSDEYILWSN